MITTIQAFKESLYNPVHDEYKYFNILTLPVNHNNNEKLDETVPATNNVIRVLTDEIGDSYQTIIDKLKSIDIDFALDINHRAIGVKDVKEITRAEFDGNT